MPERSGTRELVAVAVLRRITGSAEREGRGILKRLPGRCEQPASAIRMIGFIVSWPSTARSGWRHLKHAHRRGPAAAARLSLSKSFVVWAVTSDPACRSFGLAAG
jgi:hypothetical protein